MRNVKGKKKLTPEEVAECARLKTIWNARKKDLGLSQDEMAAELGMTQSNLSNYLNGHQSLSLRLILQLAVRIGFKPSVVRTDLAFLDNSFNGEPAGGVPIPSARPAKNAKDDLSSEMEGLDPEAQELVAKLLRKLRGA